MKKGIVLLLILLMAIGLYARTAVSSVPRSPWSKIWDLQAVSANQVYMPLTNYAIFGQDVAAGNSGCYWPAGYPNETYIFGAGIWIGAIKMVYDSLTHQIKPDTNVSCGYNPNSGETEFVPGRAPDDPTYGIDSDSARVYISGVTGWPLQAADGSDSILSIQDSYCIYNDKEPMYHFDAVNLPLDLVVIQQTYSWVGPLKEDIVFFVYTIINTGTDTLKNVYIGTVADCDVGNEAGQNANDLVGFDADRNLAYQYQKDPEPGWEHFPGYVGFKYLESPIATDTVYKLLPDYETVDTVYPGEPIGMTAFMKFTIEIDPRNKIERYLCMAGYNYLTGEYEPWPKEPDTDPADKRFIQVSGPFTMAPGDTARSVQAVLLAWDLEQLQAKADVAQEIYDAGWIGPMPPPAPSVWAQVSKDRVILFWNNAAEDVADPYYAFASDASSPAYNPLYKEYDFQGYRVYRSYDGATWELVAQYDLKDGITVIPYDSLAEVHWEYETDSLGNIIDSTLVVDSFVVTAAETVGTDCGIRYCFVDADTTLRQGIPYYYAVTAYDFNYLDSIGTPLVLESARQLSIVKVMMGTEPINLNRAQVVVNEDYLPSSVYMTAEGIQDSLIQDTTVYFLKCVGVEVYNEGGVDYPIYKMVLEDVETGEIYSDLFFDPDGGLIDTLMITMAPADEGGWEVNTGYVDFFLPVEGEDGYKPAIAMIIDSIRVDPATFGIDSVDVGNYEIEDSITLNVAVVSQPYFYAIPVTITWVAMDDGGYTLDIKDINGIEIPYDSTFTYGWAFSTSPSSFPAEPANVIYESDSCKAMYIGGVRVLFNSTSPRVAQASPLAWDRVHDGDVWTFYFGGTEQLTYGKGLYLTVIPSEYITVDDDSLLANVKVVPNPYLVRNAMEPSYNDSRIMFTNLPTECTIRIYNVAGDLIKKIEHKEENAQGVDVSGTRWTSSSGVEMWDVLTEARLIPASGVYIYVITTPGGARKVGKFAIIK